MNQPFDTDDIDPCAQQNSADRPQDRESGSTLPAPSSERSPRTGPVRSGDFEERRLAFTTPAGDWSEAYPATATLPAPNAAALPWPHRRRWKLPLGLFLVTCLSTFWAGMSDVDAASIIHGFSAIANVSIFWRDGLIYMLAVLAILLSHEMGHFVLTLRHRIPASYPLFIPMPFSPLGTMGAVIAMQGSQADRRQLFDIGIAGPLAGLVVALPVVCCGILQAPAATFTPRVVFHQPLLIQMLTAWLRPEVGEHGLQMSPLLMAGWVGFLVTGLNMLPISQLDGGHITYALLGRKAHILARLLVFLAAAYIVLAQTYVWILMLALIVLMGIDHPPTRNDSAPLGPFRLALGFLSLAIPILCFPPQGISILGG